MKKKLILSAVSVLLVAAVAVGGSLAYFTATDAAENTFTVGNVAIELIEEFAADSQLMPGKDINKDVSIQNTGNNDAYVWYLWKIPAVLDSIDGSTGTNNVVHVNSPGRTWDKYRENTSYWLEGQTEPVALEKCWDHDPETELGLSAGPEGYLTTETIDGVEYHVYAVLYRSALAPQAETPIGMTNVYMDTSVNMDDGGYYRVIRKGPLAGEKEYIDYAFENGVKIIVEAYAIQAEGFETVYDAYKAYSAQ